ncbi:MAG: hypothetical protein ACXWQO_08165 [Bdellovibrionota bacterium]
MTNNSLEKFVEGIKKAWGPLDTALIENCQHLLEELSKASVNEKWLADLHRESPEDAELYRDPVHGFVLLAHVGREGQFRVPHDHGSGWVMYAVQSGETEMRTYAQVVNPQGKMHLVRRDTYRMKPGNCKTYLPGDIHDTRYISKSILVFRLTSCDLKKEDREGRIVRYIDGGSP